MDDIKTYLKSKIPIEVSEEILNTISKYNFEIDYWYIYAPGGRNTNVFCSFLSKNVIYDFTYIDKSWTISVIPLKHITSITQQYRESPKLSISIKTPTFDLIYKSNVDEPIPKLIEYINMVINKIATI